MTHGFDEFKKYHNANYHDGDSHFDERTYQKSNGDDFDCSFVQGCYDHFEAGAASRQEEIDLLEKEIIETQQFLNNQNCIKQAEADELQNDLIKAAEGQMKLFEHNNELQKRIDDALKCAEKCTWSIALDELKKILKGESNE